jgi:hypothetical protein
MGDDELKGHLSRAGAMTLLLSIDPFDSVEPSVSTAA